MPGAMTSERVTTGLTCEIQRMRVPALSNVRSHEGLARDGSGDSFVLLRQVVLAKPCQLPTFEDASNRAALLGCANAEAASVQQHHIAMSDEREGVGSVRGGKGLRRSCCDAWRAEARRLYHQKNKGRQHRQRTCAALASTANHARLRRRVMKARGRASSDAGAGIAVTSLNASISIASDAVLGTLTRTKEICERPSAPMSTPLPPPEPS